MQRSVAKISCRIGVLRTTRIATAWRPCLERSRDLPATLMTSACWRAAAIAALTWGSPTLAAQRPDSAAHEQAARLLLQRLAGNWSFEWRSADGAGATGTRQYRVLPDSLRVVWDESYAASRRTGHGALWYHPRAQRFFYSGLYAPPVAAMLLTGRFDRSGTTVTFDLLSVANDSIPLSEGLVRSRLHVPDGDRHTWARWDNAWVVTFRRHSGSPP